MQNQRAYGEAEDWGAVNEPDLGRIHHRVPFGERSPSMAQRVCSRQWRRSSRIIPLRPRTDSFEGARQARTGAGADAPDAFTSSCRGEGVRVLSAGRSAGTRRRARCSVAECLAREARSHLRRQPSTLRFGRLRDTPLADGLHNRRVMSLLCFLFGGSGQYRHLPPHVGIEQGYRKCRVAVSW